MMRRDSDSDSDWSALENVLGVISATGAGASNRPTWQNLDERYGSGGIQARHAQVEKKLTRVSKHAKQLFWRKQRELAQHQLGSGDREEWLSELVCDVVSGKSSIERAKDILATIRNMRRHTVSWLKPRERGLPCIRAKIEAECLLC